MVLAFVLLSAGVAEATVQVGDTDWQVWSVFWGNTTDRRSQFILPASEIRDGWTTGGEIQAIGFLFESVPSDMEFELTMRLGHTGATSYADNSFINTGLTTVISERLVSGANLEEGAWGDFLLDDWFAYNGYSSLIVDVCLEIPVTGQSACISGSSRAGSDCMLSDWGNVSGGNLCDTTTGSESTYLPAVRLVGVNHELSGQLTAWNSPYELHGDCIIPEDLTLQIPPGVKLCFGPDAHFTSNGGLRAFGTAAMPVFFQGAGGAVWSGLSLSAGDTLVHAEVLDAGGTAAYVDASSGAPLVEKVRFHHNPGNTVLSVGWGAMHFSDLLLDHNHGRILFGRNYNDGQITMTACQIVQNIDNANMAFMFALDADCSLLMEDCTIADNEDYDAIFQGDTNPNELRQCALSNEDLGILAYRGSYSFKHCLMADDPDDSIGAEVEWINCVFDNPEFVDRWGMDYTPDGGSPLIDAGHPAFLDPDLTVADIGALYHDQTVPRWISLQDIPDDQGREVLLAWEASSVDRVLPPSSERYYSLWRRDSVPATRAQICSSFTEACRLLLEDPEGAFCVRETRELVWTYIESVPTTTSDSYGFVAPTLVDDENSAFRVCWHEADHFSISTTIYGASEDNVAPDTPRNLRITDAGEMTLLSWDEVTTGTSSEGRVLPELGSLSYGVYHSTNPWFVPAEENLIAETSQPQLTITVPEAPARGFYRIIARD